VPATLEFGEGEPSLFNIDHSLEYDIAERDRYLDCCTQRGPRGPESLALRQEIAALKNVLLDGCGLDASAL
jgi:hypothetical protein